MSIKSPARYRHAVIAHIFINGADHAINFYREALGATELFRVAKPDGNIVHAEILIGQSVIMIGDAEPPFQDALSLRGVPVGLHLYIDDADALFVRAIAAGATEVERPKDMFYGDRMAMVKDPFGYIWVLLTHHEDLLPDEIKRRGEALLAAR